MNVFIKLDESLHGVTVVIPTNDREIPGRYNLQIKITSPPSNAGRGPPFHSVILAAGDTRQFATGGEDPKAEAWVESNAPKFDVEYMKVRQRAFLIIEGKPDAITRFLNACKQVGIVTTQLPDRTSDEKRPSPGSGARDNVAKQNVSYILAMQQHAPLPLADSSVFVAHTQPDVSTANVPNLIDMPGASLATPSHCPVHRCPSHLTHNRPLSLTLRIVGQPIKSAARFVRSH